MSSGDESIQVEWPGQVARAVATPPERGPQDRSSCFVRPEAVLLFGGPAAESPAQVTTSAREGGGQD